MSGGGGRNDGASTSQFKEEEEEEEEKAVTVMFSIHASLVRGTQGPRSCGDCRPQVHNGITATSPTFLSSSQSHLLPIRILLTPSVACCSTFECQVRMSADDGGWLSDQPTCQRLNCPSQLTVCMFPFPAAYILCPPQRTQTPTVEAAFVGQVKDEQNPHRTPVVGGGDCPEAFLAGGVPLRPRCKTTSPNVFDRAIGKRSSKVRRRMCWRRGSGAVSSTAVVW